MASTIATESVSGSARRRCAFGGRFHPCTAASLAFFALAVAAAPRAAFADPSDQDRAVAQALFDRARALEEASKFAEACPLFEESQRLDPGAGTELNLALCYEGEQRFAKAYGLLNQSLSAAIRDARSDRRAIAEEHLAAVGPRLSMLTISVPDDARVPELILWLDGEKISSASAGVPIAVDGGAHKVEATARKFHPFSTGVALKPERDRVTVTVPRLVARAESEETSPVVAPSTSPLARSAVETAKERMPVAWGLGAAGLGLVTVGAVTGIFALVRDGEAQDLALAEGCNFERSYCPKGKTPTDAMAKSNEANALGWTSTISLGVGVTAFIVAVALPKRKVEPNAEQKPSVSVVASPVSFGLAGRF